VNSTDYFNYFVEDEGTRVLGGALERIADPARFETMALKALQASKPIVICKQGRSTVGARVAAAHTASIAGVDTVVETFLKDLGVIVVRSIEELIETSGLLARSGAPRGGRTIFFGTSGGAGGYFADLSDGTAIELVTFSEELQGTVAAIAGIAPEAAENPVDLTASGGRSVRDAVAAAAASREAEVIVVQGDEPRSPAIHGDDYIARAERNLSLLRDLRIQGHWACFALPADREPTAFGRELAAKYGIWYLHGFSGILALQNAIEYGKGKDSCLAEASYRTVRRTTIEPFERSGLTGRVSEWRGKRFLTSAGIPAPRESLCSTVGDAVAAAEALGFPVVLKVASPDIIHKTDVGGVILNVDGAREVSAGYEQIVAAARKNAPAASIEGVLVSKQMSAGCELLLGASIDPTIGPVVVIGAGGLYVETLNDTAAALPPVSEEVAAELLQSLKIWPILAGARGRPRLDLEALITAIVKFSEIVTDLGSDISLIEVNPLLVCKRGEGVYALDVAMELVKS